MGLGASAGGDGRNHRAGRLSRQRREILGAMVAQLADQPTDQPFQSHAAVRAAYLSSLEHFPLLPMPPPELPPATGRAPSQPPPQEVPPIPSAAEQLEADRQLAVALQETEGEVGEEEEKEEEQEESNKEEEKEGGEEAEEGQEDEDDEEHVLVVGSDSENDEAKEKKQEKEKKKEKKKKEQKKEQLPPKRRQHAASEELPHKKPAGGPGAEAVRNAAGRFVRVKEAHELSRARDVGRSHHRRKTPAPAPTTRKPGAPGAPSARAPSAVPHAAPSAATAPPQAQHPVVTAKQLEKIVEKMRDERIVELEKELARVTKRAARNEAIVAMHNDECMLRDAQLQSLLSFPSLIALAQGNLAEFSAASHVKKRAPPQYDDHYLVSDSDSEWEQQPPPQHHHKKRGGH